MLFVLGGNGTHAGANAIHNEVVKHISFYNLVVVVIFYSFVVIRN